MKHRLIILAAVLSAMCVLTCCGNNNPQPPEPTAPVAPDISQDTFDPSSENSDSPPEVPPLTEIKTENGIVTEVRPVTSPDENTDTENNQAAENEPDAAPDEDSDNTKSEAGDEPVPPSEEEPVPPAEPETENSPPAEVPSSPDSITLLMYHDFMTEGVPPTDWVITADMFEEDLIWLQENGYTTVLPRELAAGQLDSGEPLPEKIVMLTFDDGYTSNYTIAMPLLKQYGMKAVISLIVSSIDEGAPGHLTWEQCQQMQDSGIFEFGSHTYDHHTRDGINGIERFADETQEEYILRIGEDIRKSVSVIEAELSASVNFFAYPLGRVDSWANSLITELFSVTGTSATGKADLDNGLYKLPRNNVTANHRAASFVK